MLLKFTIEEAIRQAMISVVELTGNTSGYYHSATPQSLKQ